MSANESQRGWNGSHVPNKAPFRYGAVPGSPSSAAIESTVELTDEEVERIEKHIRAYSARYAIVRPAEREPRFLDVEYRAARPFERIRRITGYLTGSLETWNSAKRAEEKDRVKHGSPAPEEEVNLHIKE